MSAFKQVIYLNWLGYFFVGQKVQKRRTVPTPKSAQKEAPFK